VANFPTNIGYAWDFIEGLFAHLADHLATHHIRTFVAYPKMEVPPRTLANSAAQPILLDASLSTYASVRAVTEFVRREQANVAWVKATFAAAHAAGDRAIVLAFHPNPFEAETRYENGPFEPVVQAISDGADAFDGQVLIVQGHHHEFTIDRPLAELDVNKPAVNHPNVTRLQTFGWPDMKAVRVSVDVGKRWVFGFEPVYADESVSSNPLK